MRNIRVVVLCFTSLMAVAGMAMIYMATVKGKFVPGVDFSQPRHPVTAEMAERVKRLNQKVGKFYRLPDTTGKPTLIGGQGPKPQFIYFVKKGCPCSFDAEPLMQNLYKQFAGKVEFVAVTDAEIPDAKQWAKDLGVPYPVVSDSKLEVMEAYQAPAALYSSLLDKDGVIVRRWAGYSRDYLAEMNEAMWKLLGQPVKPFDPTYAPKNRTSGCTFEGYKETNQ